MKLTNKRKLILFFLVLGLAMLSCTEVLVENHTQFPVRVQIKMTGWTSYEVRRLEPNASYMFQGEEEGPYTVSAVADEDFIRKCKEKRDQMGILLNSSYNTMTKEEVQRAVNELAGFKEVIDKMKPVSCVGRVFDDSTPVVRIEWHQYTQEWSISCE